MPSACQRLARALCPLYGAKAAKNKPTSGRTDFVACFTDGIDGREDSGDFCSADRC